MPHIPQELVSEFLTRAAYTSPNCATALLRVSHWTRAIALRALFSVVIVRPKEGLYYEMLWTDFNSEERVATVRRTDHVLAVPPSLSPTEHLAVLHSLWIETDVRSVIIDANLLYQRLEIALLGASRIRRLACDSKLVRSLHQYSIDNRHASPHVKTMTSNRFSTAVYLFTWLTTASLRPPIVYQTPSITHLDLSYIPTLYMEWFGDAPVIKHTFESFFPLVTHLAQTVCNCSLEFHAFPACVQSFVGVDIMQMVVIVLRLEPDVCRSCGAQSTNEIFRTAAYAAADRLLRTIDDDRLTIVTRRGSERYDWELLSREDTDIWEVALEERRTRVANTSVTPI